MKNILVYAVFATQFGWGGIVKGQAGIVRIFLPEPNKVSVENKIMLFYPQSVCSKSSFLKEIKGFNRYFTGFNPHFSFTLDFSGSTLFQRKVWNETIKIPFGMVRFYSWVAQRIKNPKAPRAVGNALGSNPFPLVIPCHRVIKRDGGLGGFSASAGTRLKAELLQLEKNRIRKRS